VKSPVGKDFSMEDELRVNMNFSSNMVKIKVPVMHSKSQKSNETNDLQRRVEDDRKHIIDATIVKIMKSRRRLDHNSLIAETTKMLSQKFQPDVGSIKQRIEHLIEREYIERDKDDRRVFNYVA
jgi:cullin 3